MKNTLENKRAHLVKEIMNYKKYEDGIALQEIYRVISEHPQFDELFKKTNPNNWESYIRNLLQIRSDNMPSRKGKYLDFRYKGKSVYTYVGNPKHEEIVKVRVQTQNDITLYLNKLKESSYEQVRIEVNRRLNQSPFRKYLIEEFGMCPFKKVADEKLLIASHIVDYQDCDEEVDRGNPSNGILLTPDFDKLFDKKAISFSHKTGKIIIRPEHELTIKQLGLHSEYKLNKKYLTSDRIKYLKDRNQRYGFKN